MPPISIWHSKSNPYISKLSPDFPVYTMRMTRVTYDGDIWHERNNLCDHCFLSRGDRSQHHWYREMRRGRMELEEYDKIAFYTYFKMHFNEVKGMNYFWDLGRMQFILEWEDTWREEIKKFQADVLQLPYTEYKQEKENA